MKTASASVAVIIAAALAMGCGSKPAERPQIKGLMGGGLMPTQGGGGSGDITGVGVTSPIAGGGATGDVTISLSGTGCADETGFEFWSTTDGTNWSCAAELGDISGVTASTGLSGGGTSGAVSLAVDPTVIQSRLVGTCAGAGNNVKSVAQDGTVTCDTTGGDVTAVTTSATSGLAGGASSGSVALTVDETSRLKTHWEIVDDGCRSSATQNIGPFLYGTTGGAVNATTEEGAGCVTTFDSTTSSTGRAQSNANASLGFGSVANTTQCMRSRVNVPVLADGTETFVAYSGFNNTIGAIPTNGAVFIHNNSSANWLCQNRASSAGGTTDSTIAVSTGAYQLLEVCINGTTNVTYAIDGTVRCTISTNMPAASTTTVGNGLFKSVGTTSRTMKMDLERVSIDHASARF